MPSQFSQGVMGAGVGAAAMAAAAVLAAAGVGWLFKMPALAGALAMIALVCDPDGFRRCSRVGDDRCWLVLGLR